MAHEVFSDSSLLKIPTKHAAWSDRTALLMAEMSKLAYYKFEHIPKADGTEEPDKKKTGKYDQAQLDAMLARMVDSTSGATPTPTTEEEDGRPAATKGLLDLKRDLAKSGFVIAGLFNDADTDTDTQAFVAVSDNSVAVSERPFRDIDVSILSLRGTEGIKNGLTNINIFQKRVPVPGTESEALIHSGFQRAFNSVKTATSQKLQPLAEAGSTIYITGHSLGGALALIATRELARGSHESCYTFGSPRVGQFGFADYIKTPIYRVVNANDIVPRIPPAYLPTVLMLVIQVLNVPFGGLMKWALRKIAK
jgi:triacylglycerol lipase